MWQKYIPNVQVFLAVNNLIYMIEIPMVKVWFRELLSFQTQKLTYENSLLSAFSRDFTVVANDVIMQRAQWCLGLCETRQLNRYIWLARALRTLEASQHSTRIRIGLIGDQDIYKTVSFQKEAMRTQVALWFFMKWNCIKGSAFVFDKAKCLNTQVGKSLLL